MWGREGGEEEEKVQSISISTPFTYEGQLYIYIRRVTYFFGGLFFDWMERFFSFLEYRQIFGAGMDRRDTEAEEGEGGEFQLAWVDKSLDNINVLSVFWYSWFVLLFLLLLLPNLCL